MQLQNLILQEKSPFQYLFTFFTLFILVFLCPSVIGQTIVSTGQVMLMEGPIPCNTASDSADYDCLAYKAVVDADDPANMLDDPLLSTNVLLVLRYKKGTPLTINRWITLHAGGHGNGYSSAFANRITPGEYIPGGEYGDDLIRWYNELGYVTLDVIWECRDAQSGAPCFDTPFAGWVPEFSNGSGWFRNTGGTGYIGIASRTKAIIQWAMANNGGHRVGTHAHSGGSGRVMTVLTRYNGEELFDTVVFDGGPVMTYFPWICAIADDGDPNNGIETPGPLGPKPTDYDIESFNLPFRDNYDNARDTNNGEGQNRYLNCTNHIWDEQAMLDDSHFYRATDRDFSTVDMAVILGGRDATPASPNARLWFNGYSYQNVNIPALSARSLTILQGYCASTSTGTYNANQGVSPCSDWDAVKFATASEVRYEPTLINVAHKTAAFQAGANILFDTMLKTLELIPADNLTFVEEQNQVPTEFILHQNYPNPFNPETTIRYSVANQSHVQIIIYNTLGQLIRILVEGQKARGDHNIVWNGRDGFGRAVSSGVYFYELRVEGRFLQSKKMLLLQ